MNYTRTCQRFRNPLTLSGVFFLFCLGLCLGGASTALGDSPPSAARAEYVLNKAEERVNGELDTRGFRLGQPVFIRIFKLPGTLEIWMDRGQGYDLYKTFTICNYSGFPGPKMMEGDGQAPEGFYKVTPEQMNPNSQYHLSFDIGYPNAYDRAQDRTGSLIMVHGDCRSVGCFAMGDHRIEEIYMLVQAALVEGQEAVDVHIYPFPLTDRNLKKYASSPWHDFWQAMKPAYTAFEYERQVPEVAVEDGKYTIKSSLSHIAMGSLNERDTWKR